MDPKPLRAGVPKVQGQPPRHPSHQTSRRWGWPVSDGPQSHLRNQPSTTGAPGNRKPFWSGHQPLTKRWAHGFVLGIILKLPTIDFVSLVSHSLGWFFWWHDETVKTSNTDWEFHHDVQRFYSNGRVSKTPLVGWQCLPQHALGFVTTIHLRVITLTRCNHHDHSKNNNCFLVLGLRVLCATMCRSEWFLPTFQPSKSNSETIPNSFSIKYKTSRHPMWQNPPLVTSSVTSNPPWWPSTLQSRHRNRSPVPSVVTSRASSAVELNRVPKRLRQPPVVRWQRPWRQKKLETQIVFSLRWSVYSNFWSRWLKLFISITTVFISIVHIEVIEISQQYLIIGVCNRKPDISWALGCLHLPNNVHKTTWKTRPVFVSKSHRK